MWQHERALGAEGYDLIIGVDEAGRGPLAGPVVAAAVAVRSTDFHHRIDDSKRLTPAARERAFIEILDRAHVGVGLINERAIDEINILNATFAAMHNAVTHLLRGLRRRHPIEGRRICLLVDGSLFRTVLPYACRTIPGGDRQSLSIACASIVAKVCRDRILGIYDRLFPQYGFAGHKGYPTAGHRRALRRWGPSPIHRRSFRWR